MKKTLKCAECGRTFQARAFGASFCSTGCRQTFNNRRAIRGATLYDLTLLQLENPELAARYGLTDRLHAVVATWREEDAATGRKRTTKQAFEIHEATLAVSLRRRDA